MSARRSDDPIARFRRWYQAARRRQVPLAHAMVLATADASGKPSARFVLMKQLDERGLVFFTNRGSPKGRDLAENPRAALVFHWAELRKQVRFEGSVAPVSEAEADADWAKRPRAHRFESLASRQSASLRNRAELVARVASLRRELRGREIPRPDAWTGYRVAPEVVEFWSYRADRLHHRERYDRRRGVWRRRLLQP